MAKKLIHSPYGFKIFIVVLISGFFSCTSTLYVAPKRVDCSGVTDQQCYLIRSAATGNWILHYQDIEGLDYEPGFSYKIKVKKEHVKNPPMDGSAIKYTLVEVMEKKDVTDDVELEDLLEKEWKLEYLKSDNTVFGIEQSAPTLKFSSDGKISGNGSCNNYFGSFTLHGRTISFGEIGSTKMMCQETADLENAYFKALSVDLRALFSDGKLILSGDKGNQMIFGYR